MKHQIASIIAAAAMFAQPALAQHRAPAAQPPVITGPLRLDQRYQFDHYYPGPGFTMPRLPDRSVRVPHGGAEWYFHGGVWFRPSAAGFIVDVPPFGIVVPVLPPAYVTLWIDGLPYYYANGVYYTTAQDGYAVVAPPPGAEVAQPAPPSVYIYPRAGQSNQQTDSDRTACNEWASAQPGVMNTPPAFQRAFSACMEGRGYTVR